MNEDNQQLPEGWILAKLGDVIVEFIGGGTPSKNNTAYFQGDIPWFTVKDMRVTRPTDSIDHISLEAVKNSSTKLIPADTIIIATRMGLGKVIRIPFEAAINQDLKAVITPPELDKSFFEYWIIYSAQLLEKLGSGTTVTGIRLEILREMDFPLAPLAEQQRIVAAIEQQFTRLEAGVATLRQAQKKLKRYRAAVLKAAVEGSLTATWRAENPATETGAQLLARILTERRAKWEADQRAKGKDPAKVKYQEPAAPDTANLPELPEGWCVIQLNDIGEWGGGGTPSKDNIDYWIGGSIAWVSPKDMKAPKITKTEDKITEIARHERGLSMYKIGSVLFVVRSGILAHSFPVAIAEVPVTINQDMKAIELSDFFVSEYISTALVAYEQKILQECKKDGTTVASIESERLHSFLIPIAPRKEQEQIVMEVERRLSVVDEVEAEISTNLKRAERLRQSILHTAFAGQLVPQDPADEPASVLLERIRQERAGQDGNGQKPSKWRKLGTPEPMQERGSEPVKAIPGDVQQMTLIDNEE